MKRLIVHLVLLNLALIEAFEVPEIFASRCNQSCIFEPDYLTSESIKVFPRNCSKVCAYLLIDQSSDVTESQLISEFKSVKILYGSLQVKETKITSGKFLEGLEVAECDNGSEILFRNNNFMTDIGFTNLTSTSCSLDFRQNISRLNLPKLRNFYTTGPEDPLPTLRIEAKPPEFCVTIEEVTNFVTSDSLIITNLHGPFCPFSVSTFNDEKICTIENFSLENFDTSCKRIIGNVTIKSGDEPYVRKLENVTWIYGTLLIDRTNLTSIDFFNSLEFMAHFYSYSQFIGVFENLELTQISFPKLKRVRSDQKFLMLLERNNAKLFDYNLCWNLKKSLNSTEWHAPSIDGKSCEEIEYVQKVSNGIQMFLVFSVLGLLNF